MAKNVPAKMRFLQDEIDGLRARIGHDGNAVQREKLEMLADIHSDYAAASEKAAAERRAS